MLEVAPDVWQLRGFPPNAINVFVVGDVLIDAGTRWSGRRIFSQIADRKISAVALTHVHPDHQGMAKVVCEKLSVPLQCHEADVPIMEGRERMMPHTFAAKCTTLLMTGPPHPVDRVLHDGDIVAGFRVIHSPGHTPGHVIFFRDSDRVAIVGDVLNGMNLVTTWPGLHEPPSFFTWNPVINRESIRRLAELKPKLLLFGHGPPCRNPEKLQAFAKRLPSS